MVGGLQDTLDIDIGVLAAIPIGFKDTNTQRNILEKLSYTAPEVIRERASMMGGCWDEQCSAFTYVREHRDYPPERELDTLAQFDRLARTLEVEVGIEAPNPPEPGDLDHSVMVA